MRHTQTCTIIGSGPWGAVLANTIAPQSRVTLLTRTEAKANALMAGRKTEDGFTIHTRVGIDCVDNFTKYAASEWLIIAVPSTATPNMVAFLRQFAGKRVLIASKGLLPGGHLISDSLSPSLPQTSTMGVLTGPNLASEVNQGKPTASIVAFSDLSHAREARSLFPQRSMQIYTSTDLIGCQIAGALKNVVAIAAGIIHADEEKEMQTGISALGGKNPLGALCALGLSEMMVLGHRLGAKPHVFVHAAGVGDLVTTISSLNSRNHRAGQQLYVTRKPILQSNFEIDGQAVEGISTSYALRDLCRGLTLSLPVFESIHKMIQHPDRLRTIVDTLMDADVDSVDDLPLWATLAQGTPND